MSESAFLTLTFYKRNKVIVVSNHSEDGFLEALAVIKQSMNFRK